MAVDLATARTPGGVVRSAHEVGGETSRVGGRLRGEDVAFVVDRYILLQGDGGDGLEVAVEEERVQSARRCDRLHEVGQGDFLRFGLGIRGE